MSAVRLLKKIRGRFVSCVEVNITTERCRLGVVLKWESRVFICHEYLFLFVFVFLFFSFPPPSYLLLPSLSRGLQFSLRQRSAETFSETFIRFTLAEGYWLWECLRCLVFLWLHPFCAIVASYISFQTETVGFHLFDFRNNFVLTADAKLLWFWYSIVCRCT